MEGNTFVEKEMYSDPPDLPDDATKEDISAAWSKWIFEEAKARKVHKTAYTKSQKPGVMPDFDKSGILMKIGGVWKQNQSMTGLIGSSELGTLESVLIQNADQDRSISFRGKRAGRKSNRRSAKHKELKRQSILSSRKK